MGVGLGGGLIGISPRASKWLETALSWPIGISYSREHIYSTITTEPVSFCSRSQWSEGNRSFVQFLDHFICGLNSKSSWFPAWDPQCCNVLYIVVSDCSPGLNAEVKAYRCGPAAICCLTKDEPKRFSLKHLQLLQLTLLAHAQKPFTLAQFRHTHSSATLPWRGRWRRVKKGSRNWSVINHSQSGRK